MTRQLSQLDGRSYARLAEVAFVPQSILFPSSWCPTMDLFVVASPLSNRHRLTLWKMSGAKLWDVEVGRGVATHERIVSIAWSPHGLQIAVIHDPPRLSFHSVHDGREIRSIEIASDTTNSITLSGVWWLNGNAGTTEEQDSTSAEAFSGPLRRDNVIPGTAHSILQMLPLLDAQSEENESQTARLLGFGNTKTFDSDAFRPRTSSLPRHLALFPTLPIDLAVASISNVPVANRPAPVVMHGAPPLTSLHVPSSARNSQKDPHQTDAVALAGTVVVVSDTNGQLYPFLEGSYPIGTISLGEPCTVSSIEKLSNTLPFLLSVNVNSGDSVTEKRIPPVPLRLNLLSTKWLHQVAKVSSTVRALLVYLFRALGDIHKAWFGTDSLEGGRDVGIKWIKVLEEKERLYEGPKKTDPIFELTNLLFTGKTSPSMRDFLGGSGKLSERGMAQWGNVVNGALALIQEYAAFRISPAFERLVIMLEEVRGFSAWPQRFEPFGFVTTEIEECLNLCHRGIELAEWLSREAEAEVNRFHEFMEWMKSESSRISEGVVGDLRAPTFDPLEVCDYLENGLLDSPLDKWFIGPVPQINPSQFSSTSSLTMGAMLAEMRTVVRESTTEPSNPRIKSTSLSLDTQQAKLEKTDRNLIALIQELGEKCAQTFVNASCATSKQAIIEAQHPLFPFNSLHAKEFNEGNKPKQSRPTHETEGETRHSGITSGESPARVFKSPLIIRERTVSGVSGSEILFLHYTAVGIPMVPVNDARYGLCLFVEQYQNSGDGPSHRGVAVLDCCATLPPSVDAEHPNAADYTISLDPTNLDFFDDETLLVVTNSSSHRGSGAPTTLSTGESAEGGDSGGRSFLISVEYSSLPYSSLNATEVGANYEELSREQLVDIVLKLCMGGKLESHPIPIARSREIGNCTPGQRTFLAANGRENRRCACIMDEYGQHGEIFDIDADGDDDEGTSVAEEDEMAADNSDIIKE